jgi:hypothetical protein
MPAFALAPPLPPVSKVCCSESDDKSGGTGSDGCKSGEISNVLSLNTTTALPLALFVLVSTSMLRLCWPAAASEDDGSQHSAGAPLARFRYFLKLHCESPGVRDEVVPAQEPLRRLGALLLVTISVSHGRALWWIYRLEI